MKSNICIFFNLLFSQIEIIQIFTSNIKMRKIYEGFHSSIIKYCQGIEFTKYILCLTFWQEQSWCNGKILTTHTHTFPVTLYNSIAVVALRHRSSCKAFFFPPAGTLSGSSQPVSTLGEKAGYSCAFSSGI